MKLFIASFLCIIAIHLPSLSFVAGVRCWSCNSSECSQSEPKVINCEGMCLHLEYLTNSSIRNLGCEDNINRFKEELDCHKFFLLNGHGPSHEAFLRYCTCGKDLCNSPDKERILCNSCYGNRKGKREDDTINDGTTAVTDFVCNKHEQQDAIRCPLDAPLCMIKWDNESTIIGCGSHKIPKGKTTDCLGYYFSGVGECYCNADQCNTEDLKELLPRTKPKDGTEAENSGDSPISPITIIIVIVVIVVIVGLSTLTTICILKKRRINNYRRRLPPGAPHGHFIRYNL